MPKLLLDQNLSRRLVEPLQRAFPGSAHLSSFKLQSVADREIFDFARLNGFAILSGMRISIISAFGSAHRRR